MSRRSIRTLLYDRKVLMLTLRELECGQVRASFKGERFLLEPDYGPCLDPVEFRIASIKRRIEQTEARIAELEKAQAPTV